MVATLAHFEQPPLKCSSFSSSVTFKRTDLDSICYLLACFAWCLGDHQMFISPRPEPFSCLSSDLGFLSESLERRQFSCKPFSPSLSLAQSSRCLFGRSRHAYWRTAQTETGSRWPISQPQSHPFRSAFSNSHFIYPGSWALGFLLVYAWSGSLKSWSLCSLVRQ